MMYAKKIFKTKPKLKEVIKHGVQGKEEGKKGKEVVKERVLVSERKLAMRIKEGWKVIEKQGDLTLIEKEI